MSPIQKLERNLQNQRHHKILHRDWWWLKNLIIFAIFREIKLPLCSDFHSINVFINVSNVFSHLRSSVLFLKLIHINIPRNQNNRSRALGEKMLFSMIYQGCVGKMLLSTILFSRATLKKCLKFKVTLAPIPSPTIINVIVKIELLKQIIPIVKPKNTGCLIKHRHGRKFWKKWIFSI